jgi:tetratricopeptide (TPR) repeat protein
MDAEFGDAHASLAYTYAKQGRFPDAIREMKLALQYDADPVYRGNLAWIYAISGDKGNARKTIADLRRLSARQYVPTSIMAGALAELGETEQALAALEMGVQEHSSNLAMIRLDQETLYRRLRSEPRFQAVLRRIGVQ